MRRLAGWLCLLSLGAEAVACFYSVPDLASAGPGGAGPGGPGGTSGSTGGTSGGNGSVTGEGGSGSEAGTGCVDVVDVAPVTFSPVSPGTHFNGAPVIAHLGEVYGVAWMVDGDVDGAAALALQFATLDASGTVKTIRSLGAGGDLPTIAASGASFAIGSSQTGTIYRMSEIGDVVGSPLALPDPNTYQVLLTGGPDGVLVTTLTSPGGLSTIWLADGSSTLTPQAVPTNAGEGEPGCCAEREWSATLGFTPPEFVVAWQRIGGTQSINLEHVSTAGIPAPSANVVGGPASGIPTALAAYQDSVLVSDCRSLFQVGGDGTTRDTFSLPAGAGDCAILVAGSRVRMIGGAIGKPRSWSAVDLGAKSVGPSMLSIGDNVYWIRAAWDGADGFGLVWSEDALVRFAHVRTMCP